MTRLEQHLEHIRRDVVPTRGAAQQGLPAAYIDEIEHRPQPPLLARGLEQWNAHHFYAQHETLEWFWRATPDPVRDMVKGIIQAGVGAYHVTNHNRRGALAKWTGALGYLAPFQGMSPYWVDITSLRNQLSAAYQALLDDTSPIPDWADHQDRLHTFHIRWDPHLAACEVTALLRRLDRGWEESPYALTRALAGFTPTPRHDQQVRDILTTLGQTKLAATESLFSPHTSPSPIPPEPWPKFTAWLTACHEALRHPLGFAQDADLVRLSPWHAQRMPLAMIIDTLIEYDLHTAGTIAAFHTVV